MSDIAMCSTTALNTDFLGSTYSLPFAPGTVNSWFFVPTISTGETKSFQLNMLTTPAKTNFINTGYSTSFVDSPAFEPLTENLTIEWGGYVDITDSGYLINKASSFGLNINSENITASVVIGAATKSVSENITLSGDTSGYHDFKLLRESGVLYLYRDGILRGSIAAPGSIDDNGNALTINESGTVRYNDKLNFNPLGTVWNFLPSTRSLGGIMYDSSGSFAGTTTSNTKLFEIWTEATAIDPAYVNVPVVSTGNLGDVISLPGAIPGMNNSGSGAAVPQGGGGTTKIWGYDQFWVPAAAAAGVSTNFLLSLILVTLSIIVSLMFFTWFPSPIMTGVVLCVCLFVGSATGILPAWIGVLTAIAAFILLIRAGMAGF
jgi:hypothetical protein